MIFTLSVTLWLWKYSQCKSVVINHSFCYRTFQRKKRWKYLILDSTDKYEEVWSGTRLEIKTLNGGKELLYEKNYAKIGINTDNDLHLDKQLKFTTLTIIIRRLLQNGEILYPQIYLD